MCDNANNHSHAHGVRSDAEKVLADLREDMSEALRAVTKYESQRAVMSNADFPAVGDVIHTLGHLMEDQKRHVAELMRLITKVDMVQKKLLDQNGNGTGHGHDHPEHDEHHDEHDGHDEHDEEHAHGHSH